MKAPTDEEILTHLQAAEKIIARLTDIDTKQGLTLDQACRLAALHLGLYGNKFQIGSSLRLRESMDKTVDDAKDTFKECRDAIKTPKDEDDDWRDGFLGAVKPS
jgi:diaminopimelate decarboxylase